MNKPQYLFTILLQNMSQQQINPSNATNMAHVQITQCAFMGEACQYTGHTYDVAPINNVARIALHR